MKRFVEEEVEVVEALRHGLKKDDVSGIKLDGASSPIKGKADSREDKGLDSTTSRLQSVTDAPTTQPIEMRKKREKISNQLQKMRISSLVFPSSFKSIQILSHKNSITSFDFLPFIRRVILGRSGRLDRTLRDHDE